MNLGLLTLRAQQPFRPDVAYFAAGLSALAYLDPSSYAADLSAFVGGASVQRHVSAVSHVPAVLVLRNDGDAWCAVEGTRDWGAWLSYVTGAGVERWPPAVGVAFGPFVRAAGEVGAWVETLTSGATRVVLVGHSLGAAVAQMVHLQRRLTGRAILASITLGCPVTAERSMASQLVAKAANWSHPLDPVPLLPADALGVLRGTDTALRLVNLFTQIVPRGWLLSTATGVPSSRLNYWAALALQAIDWRTGCHQTYHYLRELLQEIKWLQLDADFSGFTLLLARLGLLDPWP